jgi:hypothetical protein
MHGQQNIKEVCAFVSYCPLLVCVVFLRGKQQITPKNVMGTEMCTRMVLSLTVVLFSDGFSVQFN